MTITTARRRIAAAATLALGAGAITISAIALSPVAQANASMTFEQACGITHGRIANIAAAGIQQCFWQDPNTGNEWFKNNSLLPPLDPTNPPSAPSGTTFGQACLVTQGWDAVVVTAGIEECHWQDADGNEHIITSPLPNKKVPIGKVTAPPVLK
jgi:uncharacterized protein YodC (DUF2158 family)